jgi:uncharacterized protein
MIIGVKARDRTSIILIEKEVVNLQQNSIAMKIKISKPSKDEIERMNVYQWPIWEKEESNFPWTYDAEETCFIIEGHVFVVTQWETVEIQPGDLVVFPAGLSCQWDIRKAVRKHYQFAN